MYGLFVLTCVSVSILMACVCARLWMLWTGPCSRIPVIWRWELSCISLKETSSERWTSWTEPLRYCSVSLLLFFPHCVFFFFLSFLCCSKQKWIFYNLCIDQHSNSCAYYEEISNVGQHVYKIPMQKQYQLLSFLVYLLSGLYFQ